MSIKYIQCLFAGFYSHAGKWINLLATQWDADKSSLLFDGREKNTYAFLDDARCLFVCWEMDIKGKTEKHQWLNLSTQTYAFVSDWWSKKFRHADLTVFWVRRLSLYIHLKEFHLASPSFSSPSPSLFTLLSFLDPFLKGQADYHVAVLAHTFVRCKDRSREWKRRAVTLWPLCCS